MRMQSLHQIPELSWGGTRCNHFQSVTQKCRPATKNCRPPLYDSLYFLWLLKCLSLVSLPVMGHGSRKKCKRLANGRANSNVKSRFCLEIGKTTRLREISNTDDAKSEELPRAHSSPARYDASAGRLKTKLNGDLRGMEWCTGVSAWRFRMRAWPFQSGGRALGTLPAERSGGGRRTWRRIRACPRDQSPSRPHRRGTIRGVHRERFSDRRE